MGTKKVTVGILAHVDAGKTTLAEAILYRTGTLRRLGRVDHQDAFLDTDAMERARGITIFSKQAKFVLGDFDVTLLDTPGHVDFSAEMERTLQVLDYAVLVISGADGVQGHVETLWRLLSRYQIPTVLFINKMDQEGTEEDTLLLQLQKQLNEHCIKVCSMPQPPDNADIASGIRPLGTGTDAVSAMRTNASDLGGCSTSGKGKKVISVFFWIGTKSLWRGCAIVRADEADERAGIHRGVWGTCF